MLLTQLATTYINRRITAYLRTFHKLFCFLWVIFRRTVPLLKPLCLQFLCAWTSKNGYFPWVRIPYVCENEVVGAILVAVIVGCSGASLTTIRRLIRCEHCQLQPRSARDWSDVSNKAVNSRSADKPSRTSPTLAPDEAIHSYYCWSSSQITLLCWSWVEWQVKND